ncbi:Gmad2 immunoglobulin-like domain-containing protein [Nocardioides sp.]|uniref:Gmad2 immunoglobulin-like domain-containing protein n=1 Tax=Nocardioides sp. TaxID=35761 RepID=UPI002ED5B931
MNRPDTDFDPQLADLLHDAVADVEPDDQLADIRARIPRRSTARRWGLLAGGGALAVAATVTAIALASGPSSVTTDPDVAEDPPSSGDTTAVAAYFVGETPTGDRLFREFQPVEDATAGLSGLALLESGPTDPDYTSLWPEGSFEDRLSDPEAGVVHVYLTDAAPEEPSELALQQVVYTVRAGLQEQVQVAFHSGETLVATVAAAPQLDTLSLVNLSDPAEGQAVGDSLHVSGVANSFEATVPWRIQQGSTAVDGGFFTAEGSMGTRLFPFSGEIDVSSLDPGSYTLIVETSDPSGGSEGPGAYSDSRSFVIE